jgi:hypothetical protein
VTGLVTTLLNKDVLAGNIPPYPLYAIGFFWGKLSGQLIPISNKKFNKAAKSMVQ